VRNRRVVTCNKITECIQSAGIVAAGLWAAYTFHQLRRKQAAESIGQMERHGCPVVFASWIFSIKQREAPRLNRAIHPFQGFLPLVIPFSLLHKSLRLHSILPMALRQHKANLLAVAADDGKGVAVCAEEFGIGHQLLPQWSSLGFCSVERTLLNLML
jgi:hypothetical protein